MRIPEVIEATLSQAHPMALALIVLVIVSILIAELAND